jgi:hypothetical protein
MKVLVRSLIFAVALGGVASAEPPPAKAPPAEKKAPPKAPAETKKEEVPAADLDKFLAFYNKFVDMAVAAKEDCAKLTKDASTLIDANADIIKRMQDHKAAGKVLPQAAREKMLSRVKEMMPIMNKCGNDPAFQAIMKKMQGNGGGAKTETTKPAEPAKTPPAKK